MRRPLAGLPGRNPALLVLALAALVALSPAAAGCARSAPPEASGGAGKAVPSGPSRPAGAAEPAETAAPPAGGATSPGTGAPAATPGGTGGTGGTGEVQTPGSGPAGAAPPDGPSPATGTTQPPAAPLDGTRLSWYFTPGQAGEAPSFGRREQALADRYAAIYLGPTDRRVVYLTFDEGYEAGTTPAILDTLKAHGVRAAFFITGSYLEREPELVARMLREGHVVGNHTLSHPSLPALADEEAAAEIRGLETAFRQRFGQRMRFLRPPMGEFSERTLAVARQLGYRAVFWSFAYRDWETDRQPTPEEAFRTVTSAVHPGAVLLLHAVSSANAQALDRILSELEARGYTFGSLEEL